MATIPTKNQYNQVNEYQEIMIPILAMETLGNACAQTDTVVVHGIPASLEFEGRDLYGHMVVRNDFAEERDIFSLKARPGDDDWEAIDVHTLGRFSFEIGNPFCLRFPTKPSAHYLPEGFDDIKEHLQHRNKWVCHAVAIDKQKERGKSGQKKRKTADGIISFKVRHFNTDPPEEIMDEHLFRNDSQQPNCTVEIVEKSLSDR